MRKILFLLLLPAWLSAQTTTKGKRPCTPSRPPFICCPDTSKVIVNVAAPSSSCCDTTFIKKLLDHSCKKDKKDIWDIISTLLSGIVPIILGFLAYKYVRSQNHADNISKARIEWIRDFRPLIAESINNMLRFKASYDDYEQTDETDEEYPKIQETMEKDFYNMNLFVNKVLVSLNPDIDTQRELQDEVEKFSNQGIGENIGEEIKAVRKAAQLVIAEQWKLAGKDEKIRLFKNTQHDK